MKKISILTCVLAIALMAGACNSGSSQKEGKDSVQNNYDTPSTKDTSAVTSETGDASLKDNSGNGGTVPADSAQKDSTKK